MQGWISLHRDITKHWLWEEKPFDKARAWIDLLLMANHEQKTFKLGNELVTVERGSFITSELKLMKRWDWSKTKVRSFLLLLQNDSMIVQKKDRKKTTISIVNYDAWQNTENQKRPQKDYERTTEKPQKDTNNNDNNYNNIKNGGGNITDNLIPLPPPNVNINPEIFYNQNFGLITPYIQQNIQYFIQDGVDEELILRKMQDALKNNIRNWNYVSKALQNLLNQNIKTLSQYEAHEIERNRTKNKPPEPVRPKYEICKAPDGWGR